METAKKSFTPPANKPILLPDITLPVFLAIPFPQKREMCKLHGLQHRHEEGLSPGRRLAPSIFRIGHALAATLLCGERSGHAATYLQIISGIQFMTLLTGHLNQYWFDIYHALSLYLICGSVIFTLRLSNLMGHFFT
ncbi:MAG: hypothetical protein E7I22_02410 [Bifidobacterium longum]|nr:hypothetical protein [Bifidobacterium longum]